MMKSKDEYMIDEQNRLVIRRKRQKILTCGRFGIGRNNRLVYWLNAPKSTWVREYGPSGKITFRGAWQLNSSHNLELKLAETREHKSGNIELKGKIISADNDKLIFELICRDEEGRSHFQLLKLSGSWQADEANRIIFAVKKQAPDILTLQGAWQLNPHQQIIYTYIKTGLKTKDKQEHSLTFTGFWQINSANRLTYVLERGSLSRFSFRAQVESPNLYPQQGAIKYRLGIGLSERRAPVMKIISLYGDWKFNRRLGLSFVMDYGKGRASAIDFGTELYLNKKDTVIFALTDKRGEPLGFSVTFTHKFLQKNAALAFLRIKKLEGEGRIESGLRFNF